MAGGRWPALISNTAELEAAGDAGGACDAAAAAQGWTGNGDDAAGAAGWPLFGQLIGHDITADRSPVRPQFYILKEAQACGGDQLGPVGGRIVAEVLIGLLRADPGTAELKTKMVRSG